MTSATQRFVGRPKDGDDGEVMVVLAICSFLDLGSKIGAPWIINFFLGKFRPS
jgi:hypothetical protein